MSRMSAVLNHTSKKTSWPELKGLPGEVAKHKILADRPDLKVHLVPHGYGVTDDYDTGRVWIFLNKAGNVLEVPQIG